MNSDYDLYKKSNYSEPHSQNRLCEAVLNNMPACYLLMWLLRRILPDVSSYICKHPTKNTLSNSAPNS